MRLLRKPKIYLGEKQSIACEVFPLGFLVLRLFKEAKLEMVKKCQSSNPRQRPKLSDLFIVLTKLSLSKKGIFFLAR